MGWVCNSLWMDNKIHCERRDGGRGGAHRMNGHNNKLASEAEQSRRAASLISVPWRAIRISLLKVCKQASKQAAKRALNKWKSSLEMERRSLQ